MNQAVEYTARDKNAYRGSRAHDVVLNDGTVKNYAFPNESTFIPVPTEVAMKLSKIPGFEVKDTRGLVVVPQQIEEQTGLNEIVSLSSDQVIANLNELTKEALIVRANAPELGGKFKNNASKESLVQFLTDYNLANPASADEADLNTEEELEVSEEGGV
jgi:hypothetical protein